MYSGKANHPWDIVMHYPPHSVVIILLTHTDQTHRNYIYVNAEIQGLTLLQEMTIIFTEMLMSLLLGMQLFIQ